MSEFGLGEKPECALVFLLKFACRLAIVGFDEFILVLSDGCISEGQDLCGVAESSFWLCLVRSAAFSLRRNGIMGNSSHCLRGISVSAMIVCFGSHCRKEELRK